MKVLQEFVNDIEAVGQENVQDDWPDLYVTYQKAKGLLEARPREYVVIQQQYVENDHNNIVKIHAISSNRDGAVGAAQQAANVYLAAKVREQTIEEDAGRIVQTESDGQLIGFRVLDGDWCDSVFSIQVVEDCEFSNRKSGIHLTIVFQPLDSGGHSPHALRDEIYLP